MRATLTTLIRFRRTTAPAGSTPITSQIPRSASARRDRVIGAVVLWGTVELHGGGMRASHARIVGLMLPPTRGPKRRGLIAAAAYLEVPVVPFRKLKAVGSDGGSAAPNALRPPRTPLPWEAVMGASR